MTETAQSTPRRLSHGLFWLLWLSGLLLSVAAFLAAIYWLKARHAPMWMAVAASAVYAVAIVALSVLPGVRAMRGAKVKPSPAALRYARRFIISMSAYTIVLLLAVFAFVAFKPVGPLAWLLALAPVVPLLASLASIGLYLHEETDEFQRSMQAQAMLLATGGAFAVATAWGFLEQFNLAPHAPAWAIYPLWAVMLIPAQLIVRTKYK